MRRKVGLSLVFGAVLPLAVASTAWACGVLATLTLNTSVASPNQTVTATGKNYKGTTPVSIHLMSRGGTVVATVNPPGSAGGFSQAFQVPANTNPGWYVLVATQATAAGTPAAGTPGRTTLRIQGSGAAATARSHRGAAASPWGSSDPTAPTGSAAPVAREGGGLTSPAVLPMLLAVVLSLTLLASGLTLAGRRNQTATSRAQLGV